MDKLTRLIQKIAEDHENYYKSWLETWEKKSDEANQKSGSQKDLKDEVTRILQELEAEHERYYQEWSDILAKRKSEIVSDLTTKPQYKYYIETRNDKDWEYIEFQRTVSNSTVNVVLWRDAAADHSDDWVVDLQVVTNGPLTVQFGLMLNELPELHQLLNEIKTITDEHQ